MEGRRRRSFRTTTSGKRSIWSLRAAARSDRWPRNLACAILCCGAGRRWTPIRRGSFQRRHHEGLQGRYRHLHRGIEGRAGKRRPESTRKIDIDEFVPKSDIDPRYYPRYLIRPYYLTPDGKVGHDAYAVIRETIRSMDMVAIGRVVLTNREHIIALEDL
jgi:hypothetical protein